MQEPDHTDPERSALTEGQRREHLREEAVLRREAVLSRVANVREILVAAVAIACCGLTIFIDVAAPVSNGLGAGSSSSAQGLSGGSPPSVASDTGVAVSGAS